MYTKGRFTREKWDHLLRLVNIMNSSMFFIQRTESRVSWAQESTAKEGSAVAKPRPMNLVSRNFLSAKKNPPQDSSDSNSPENQEFDQSSVSSSGRKRETSTQTQQWMYSQERQQDDSRSPSTRKLGRRDEPSSSASARKLERGEDIQIGRSNIEFHNMQISGHRCLEKVVKNLRKKLNLAERSTSNWNSDMGLFISTTTKAAIHPGPNYFVSREVYRNTNTEELQNLFDITQKLILDHPAEILNVTTIDRSAPSWERSALSHDQVITWYTSRKMGLHTRTDGGTIQRNLSPSIQEHQCFESWNSEKKE